MLAADGQQDSNCILTLHLSPVLFLSLSLFASLPFPPLPFIPPALSMNYRFSIFISLSLFLDVSYPPVLTLPPSSTSYIVGAC